MKIFLSWSKPLSKQCAELLGDWIKCTLQASSPWVSSKDIDKGTLWFNEINSQLKDTAVGIVFLTKENKNNPWILFEAGALAKGLSSNKVCTFLIDLTPADLESPLSQFNHTMPNKDSVKGLLLTINKELGDSKLDNNILDKIFETYWPQLELDFNAIIKSIPLDSSEEPERSESDILTEILYTTRTMDKRIRNLESNSVEDYENSRSPTHSEKRMYLRNQIAEALNQGHSVSDIIANVDLPSEEIKEHIKFLRNIKGINKLVEDFENRP